MKAVHAAFEPLAKRLSLSVDEVAHGVIRVANHNMINALKLVSVSRGHDPRNFSLIAFGGGGGLHAAALAAELKIGRVIIPRYASVFSAWGMLLSDLRRDHVLTRPISLNGSDATRHVVQTLQEMQTHARAEYAAEGVADDRVYFQLFLDMRYDGQEHTVKVALSSSGAPITAELLIERFNAAFRQQFTYNLSHAVEIVNFHVVAFARVNKPQIAKLTKRDRPARDAIKGTRDIGLEVRRRVRATVYDRALLDPGASLEGPAIVEQSDTSTIIGTGQRATIDDYGNIHILITPAEAGDDRERH
jgi:N-methylhydantoinase A